MKQRSGFYGEIDALVLCIPCGRVATYGQIAAWLDRPMAARAVGYALSALDPDSAVPWWRVINQKGRLSPRGPGPHGSLDQRRILESEGLVFIDDALDLNRYGWGRIC